MVNNTEKRSLDIVEGTIEKVFSPSENAAGKWRAGKVYINTANGGVAVSFWPAGDWDDATRVKVTRIPVEMSDEWHQLQGREGARVQLIAERGDDFDGKPQYQNAVIKSIDGASSEAPVAPAPAPPAPAAPAPPIDGPRWGQNLNIAVALRTTYPDSSDDELFAKATSLAVKFYAQTPEELWQLVLAERASKEQPEPEFIASLGTLSEDN